MTTTVDAGPGQRARTVLFTLAAGQFLMTLDSSVMNGGVSVTRRARTRMPSTITTSPANTHRQEKSVEPDGPSLWGSPTLWLNTILTGIENYPSIPAEVSSQANVQLASGAPVTSDADRQAALVKAGPPPDVAAAALEVNKEARVAGLRAAIAFLALTALLALFFTRPIPTRPVGQPSPQGPDR